jgi:hypothetical protein
MKLPNALLQLDEVIRKNKALEEQLRLAAGEGILEGGIRCRVILKVGSA